MLKIVTIGTGMITSLMLQGSVHVPDLEVYGVYSRSKDKAENLACKYCIEHIYTSLECVAMDKNVDAVYIASPNSLHAEQAIYMMNHGKSVLCEKPSASNIKELDSMLECSAKNNVLFMEAYKAMFMPNFRKFVNSLPMVGKITDAEMNFCRYSSRYDAYNRGEDINTFKTQFSNGAVMDMGLYCIYPLIYILGMPQNIDAIGELMDTGVDAWDKVDFKYGDFNAHMSCAKTYTTDFTCSITGTNGKLTLNALNIPDKVMFYPTDGSDAIDLSVCQLKDHMCYELDEFTGLFQSGKKESLFNTHVLSRNVLQIIQTIRNRVGVVYPADHI